LRGEIPLTDDQVMLHQQIQADTITPISKSSNLIATLDGGFRKLLSSV
jgi:hypothetical protein